ncbi:MAG: hypothetical protein J6A21_00350 [Lentisphaeria bacterium]|nr:hypothetical protein [Lentisphaeria bacterium]
MSKRKIIVSIAAGVVVLLGGLLLVSKFIVENALETETLLTEDEKKTLGILNDIHVPARLKKEALNKLKARFRPDLYEKEGRKRGLL